MPDLQPAHEAAPPPEGSLLWELSFARGYLELGMFAEAERALKRLPQSWQERADVMALRSHLLLARGKWARVIRHARRARRLHPDAPEFYVHAAAAYDMLGLPEEGRDVWRAAPEPVRSSGFAHLHVARFEAQLGNVDAARDHLARAIRIDPHLRTLAGRDPRLAPILPQLGKN
jgi:tetratricopeptide (TPR) repeat protein